ncbi:MAG: TonB-dependent receptor [Bacteroidales bacterium]|nr:TonB-dependent receptor [Bacteroidales bacterium]
MKLIQTKVALTAGLSLALLCGGAPAVMASPLEAAQTADQVRVTGTVTDTTGEPLIGANVLVKGQTKGVNTDIDGQFTLDVAVGDVLTVSYIGYLPQEVTVKGPGNLDIVLSENATMLDEVVAVGYGVQKKKLVTGATVEVKGEDVAKMNTTQVLGALQSQTPGVNIQAASGQPGDGFKVNIRGAGTNGSTTPLYVIDGVSGGDINSLNPADIERIDVLKDAASCAIYGSAAANGVILITTKQGAAGKTQVTYDGNVGWQNVYKLPQMLTAKQYMEIMNVARFNNGQSLYNWSDYIDADLLTAYNDGSNPGTDWVDAFRNKNAVTTNHALNIAGGGDMYKYSTGIGYQYQDGVFGGPVKSDFRRLTFRLNSESVLWRYDDRDIIKFGENIYYQHRQSQGIQIGNQYSNELSNALRANPCIPIYNADGEYFMYEDLLNSGEKGWFDYNAYSSNPVAAAVYGQSGNNKSKSYNLSATGYVEVQPIKGLRYRGQVGYKQYSSSWRCFLPVFQINTQSGGFRTESQMSDNVSLGWSWNTTHTLNMDFNIKESHFDVLAGMEYSKSRPGYGESVNATATGLIFDDLKHAYLSNAENRQSAVVSGYGSDYGAKLSYFGRINYDFAEKYMLSVIFRADGSSKFAKGHQWGYFPSVSGGWVVSNESFMENTHSWLSFLKIRAGWGQNGNDNIDASQYIAGWDFGDYGQYSFGNLKDIGTTGAYPNRLANPDLTWETSEQVNVGFDARFFNGKFTANFDWYRKTTKDLLIWVNVNGVTGFTGQYQNAGSVRNEGVELSLNWNDNIGKDMWYSINYNVAHNKNKVTAVNNSNHYVEGGNDLLSQSTGIIARMEEGYPIGYFYGFKTDGVIQNQADLDAYLASNCGGDAANSMQGTSIAPGDLKFVDVNGDGLINDDDRTDLGNPHPDYTMGLTLSFGYKAFDISATAYGAFGQQVARSYRKFSDGQNENYTTEVYEYWHGEGTSNRYPTLGTGSSVNWMKISDIFIDDASYVRLQNITVGFDIAKAWKGCPLQQLRVYATAQNLFTITGYKGMDPENGAAIGSEQWVTGVDIGNYPQPRTYLVGVNVKF